MSFIKKKKKKIKRQQKRLLQYAEQNFILFYLSRGFDHIHHFYEGTSAMKDLSTSLIFHMNHDNSYNLINFVTSFVIATDSSKL